MRDSSPRPYLRERAAALLKIAEGMPAAHVARFGLLRPRAEDTVYRWINRFQRDGIAALTVTGGRGRKPAFSPQYPTSTAARENLLHTLRRDPRQFGLPQTRWTLDALQQVVTWMRRLSFAGIHRVLDRLTIRYKRGRDYVHSPDPDYRVKLADIARCLDQARQSGSPIVTLYLDEITYYRQPSLVRAYEAEGPIQPLAQKSYRSNTPTRLVGTVDPRDGRVLYRQRSEIGVSELVTFFQTVRAAHQTAERINIIVDNWPVHFHPDVLVALGAQENPWPHHRPSSWSSGPSPAARKKWATLQQPIQLRPLPTYASWTNPIEKLWRKLRQDVLHLHRLADDLKTLRARVADFLDHYATGSPDLLRYVGILVPD